VSILLHRKRRIEGALEQFEHKAAVEISGKVSNWMPASLRRKMMIWLNTSNEIPKENKQWAQEMMDSMTQNAKIQDWIFI
jgi:protein disulfide-isomerase